MNSKEFDYTKFADFNTPDIIKLSQNLEQSILDTFDYDIKNKHNFSLAVLSFTSWTFSVACELVKPPFWRDILDKTHQIIDESLYGDQRFLLLTRKLYPRLNHAMKDPQKMELGSLMMEMCFGEEIKDISAISFFNRIAYSLIDTDKKMIKNVFKIIEERK